MSGVEQQLEGLGRRDTVDHGVVDLVDEADRPVGQTAHEPHLPQRPRSGRAPASAARSRASSCSREPGGADRAGGRGGRCRRPGRPRDRSGGAEAARARSRWRILGQRGNRSSSSAWMSLEAQPTASSVSGPPSSTISAPMCIGVSSVSLSRKLASSAERRAAVGPPRRLRSAGAGALGDAARRGVRRRPTATTSAKPSLQAGE